MKLRKNNLDESFTKEPIFTITKNKTVHHNIEQEEQIKSLFMLSLIIGTILGCLCGLKNDIETIRFELYLLYGVFITLLWTILNIFLDVLWFENEYDLRYTLAKVVGFGVMFESTFILITLFI